MRITNELDITRLGLRLGVERHTVSAICWDHRHDIRNAANEVLQAWKSTVPTPEEAYETLGEALLDCEFSNIAYHVLGFL